MATEAADIVAVAELLGSPVLLVGHSSGAVAALEAALLDPTAFAGLFLYEPPMPTRELLAGPAGVRARSALDAGDPVEAMRIHMRDIVRMPANTVDEMFADARVRAAFAACAPAQIADDEALDALGVGIDRFATLETPTTLLEGGLSPAHLRERLADLAATCRTRASSRSRARGTSRTSPLPTPWPASSGRWRSAFSMREAGQEKTAPGPTGRRHRRPADRVRSSRRRDLRYRLHAAQPEIKPSWSPRRSCRSRRSGRAPSGPWPGPWRPSRPTAP